MSVSGLRNAIPSTHEQPSPTRTYRAEGAIGTPSTQKGIEENALREFNRSYFLYNKDKKAELLRIYETIGGHGSFVDCPQAFSHAIQLHHVKEKHADKQADITQVFHNEAQTQIFIESFQEACTHPYFYQEGTLRQDRMDTLLATETYYIDERAFLFAILKAKGYPVGAIEDFDYSADLNSTNPELLTAGRTNIAILESMLPIQPDSSVEDCYDSLHKLYYEASSDPLKNNHLRYGETHFYDNLTNTNYCGTILLNKRIYHHVVEYATVFFNTESLKMDFMDNFMRRTTFPLFGERDFTVSEIVEEKLYLLDHFAFRGAIADTVESYMRHRGEYQSELPINETDLHASEKAFYDAFSERVCVDNDNPYRSEFFLRALAQNCALNTEKYRDLTPAIQALDASELLNATFILKFMEFSGPARALGISEETILNESLYLMDPRAMENALSYVVGHDSLGNIRRPNVYRYYMNRVDDTANHPAYINPDVPPLSYTDESSDPSREDADNNFGVESIPDGVSVADTTLDLSEEEILSVVSTMFDGSSSIPPDDMDGDERSFIVLNNNPPQMIFPFGNESQVNAS